MFDANTLIEALSGGPASLSARLAHCDEGDLTISAIAFAEVALGSWQGKRPSIIALDQVSRHIEVVPFDHRAAQTYAQLPFRRASFDRLIAAHALSLNLILVTDNERDFADMPELTVENWTR